MDIYTTSRIISTKIPYDELEEIFKNGFDLNTKNVHGKSFLFYQSKIEKVELALRYGADINIQATYNGDTPLMQSIASNSDMFKFMLDNGSDITLKNRNGCDIRKELKQEIKIMCENYDCNCHRENFMEKDKKCFRCGSLDDLYVMQDYLENYIKKRISLFEIMFDELNLNNKKQRFY